MLGTARLTLRPASDASVPRSGRLTLRDVQVRGDSVVGLGRPGPGARQRIAVHRDQVMSVEFGQPNRWGTAAAVVLAVVAAYGAIVLYVVATYGVGD